METEKRVDLLIIGGGSAGMAAALAAAERGISDILIAERSKQLGGVLQQCIHSGFGLHKWGEELTGTEYGFRYQNAIAERGIPVWTNAVVIQLTADRDAVVVTPQHGLCRIHAKAVILTTGCQERTRGMLLIPGSRPAGIMTAGTAQRYLNLMGYLPGRQVVILGSGDIGLILARQLAMEGVTVKEVVEIQPFSSGLPRNIVQCLDDFQIPLHLNSTVTSVYGRSRVEGATISRVDETRRPIAGTERKVPCDTLILSAGLVPDYELIRQAGLEVNSTTGAIVVNQHFMSSCEGIFVCGNLLHVHDLVDQVSEEAALAGQYAAEYSLGFCPYMDGTDLLLRAGEQIQAVVPQKISPVNGEQSVQISFRVRRPFEQANLVVRQDGRVLRSVRFPVLVPGTMEHVDIAISGPSRSPVVLSVE